METFQSRHVWNMVVRVENGCIPVNILKNLTIDSPCAPAIVLIGIYSRSEKMPYSGKKG